MRDIPNAAVVGYGYAGRAFHSYLIGLEPGLKLCGIASRDPETRSRIEAERGCRAYESFEQVIEDPEIDLVVLATPNHVHAEYAVRAMDRGRHVVTDKPMCTNLKECDRMIASSRKNGVVLSVFQNRRWDGDFLTLRSLMDRGMLGRLRWLEMAWVRPGAPGGWRAKTEFGGGRLFDLGAHMLDQVLLLFPRAVTSVYCRTHHDYTERDVESHGMIILGFSDGATAVIDTGGMHHTDKPRMQAFGTEGSYVKYGVDPQEEAMKAGQIDSADEPEDRYGKLGKNMKEQPVPTLAGRWRNYYEMIAAQITGRPLPHAPVRLEEARRVMAVLDAAFESARSGGVICTDIPGLDR